MTSKLGEKYYKKKGIITKVEDCYQAVVKMIDTNDKIRLDQAHVETVIPTIGKIPISHARITMELDLLLFFFHRKESVSCQWRIPWTRSSLRRYPSGHILCWCDFTNGTATVFIRYIIFISVVARSRVLWLEIESTTWFTKMSRSSPIDFVAPLSFLFLMYLYINSGRRRESSYFRRSVWIMIMDESVLLCLFICHPLWPIQFCLCTEHNWKIFSKHLCSCRQPVFSFASRDPPRSQIIDRSVRK